MCVCVTKKVIVVHCLWTVYELSMNWLWTGYELNNMSMKWSFCPTVYEAFEGTIIIVRNLEYSGL